MAIAHCILANDKAHKTAEDHLFLCMLRCVQNCGSDYKPPTRYEVGGILLDASYETYCNDEVSKMMKDVKIYGASIYGDGATVEGTPKINVLASTPSNPACLLDVIDCTMHMQEGGIKDAKYIAMEMVKINPSKWCFKQILLDRASNVQKVGQIMQSHFPQAQVTHGTEHVVSLVVGKCILLPGIREYSTFAKVVSNMVSLFFWFNSI